MEKKTLHVVSSLSVSGTLRMGLREMNIKPEITYFPIDLSCGYIPKDFSDKELCFALASHGQIEIFDELKKFVTTDYSQYAKVIVWHGWSAYDQLLLFLMSVLVKGTLYHVDLRDCKGFMEKYLSKDPSRAYPDFGYVSAYDIYTYNMISLVKPLNDDDKKYYSRQWFKWANSKAPYRFSDIHTGVIEEYPENFMDDSIKEYAQKYSSFIMVILNVLRKYDDLFISDNIVKRRIYQLRDYGIIKLFVSLNEEK